jgi:CzcA family heavy metal efflux pump
VTLFDVLQRQRRLVLLAVAGLSAGGIWTATRMPSAIYPELVFERIGVVVTGSSLGAREMIFSVTRPLEEAMSVVQFVTRVRSRTIRGATELSITFAPGSDMQYALQQVQARVNEARQQIPEGLDFQVERLVPSLFPILSYNLEGGDAATLYDIARYQIRPVISRIPGVGRVEVQGADVRELEVVADPGRLAALDLTYEDLASAIRTGITPTAVGRVAKDYKQFLLVTDQEAHDPEAVADLVVRPGLRVRDVATVTLGTEDRVRLITGDAHAAALINVSRQTGGNTVAVADSVARAMAMLQQTLPSGAVLKPVYDQSELVRDSVRAVRDAMLLGAVLAVVILLLFLRHLTITAISAAAIPLTLAITVFVMRLAGQTFNLMTLGAMAIAIGLVIDDAVVVVENIARHLAIDGDHQRAIRDAVQELLWPVTTSTLTTVVVFLPLGLLTGVVGQFFVALSITLTIAVLVSLALALTVIPLLAHRYLAVIERAERESASAASAGRQGVLARIGGWIERRTRDYGRALEAAIGRPGRVGIAALLLVGAGVVGARVVGTGFLPAMDEGAFVLDYFTPGGTALTETDRELKVAEHILLDIPEITGISRRTGAELGLFATGQNTGDVVGRLAPHGQRSRSIFEVIDEARGRIAAAVPRMRIEFIQILSDVINDLAGNPNPVEVKLFGDRLDDLEAYAHHVGPALEAIDGLEDFYDGVSEPSPELRVRVRAADAARAGVTPEDVGARVSGALLGVDAGSLRLDDRAIGVRVRAPDSVRFAASRLGALPLALPDGRSTSLAALADLRETESRAELLRENQRQMIAMTGQVEGRSLGEVTADVRRALAADPPPAGIQVEIGGQSASQREAFRAFILVLVLAGASVVAVMVVQFESFVEPAVILLAAPVSFAGAVALLLATGTPLNVSSFMGLILLVGLIVKNGIIFLDFTRRRMRDGSLPLGEAIREAGEVRLRPILMTTLCTLFGLLPLALGVGAGSELQRPLALAVIGGLALSTPVTLFVVPTLLVAIRGRGWTLGREPRATP